MASKRRKGTSSSSSGSNRSRQQLSWFGFLLMAGAGWMGLFYGKISQFVVESTTYYVSVHNYPTTRSSTSSVSSGAKSPRSLESSSPSTRNDTAGGGLDLVNPTWPKEPPFPDPSRCKITFREIGMHVCHILPWANFGDELGPIVVKRILELYFPGCSAQDLPVFDLSVLDGSPASFYDRREYPQLKRCFMTVGSLWRMVQSGDHIWGTGAAFGATIQARCRTRAAARRSGPHVKHVTVYSSRGPISAKSIQVNCNYTTPRGGTHIHNTNTSTDTINRIEPAGDAGFLVPYLFPEHMVDSSSQSNEKQLCFIPHYHDAPRPIWNSTNTPYKRLTVDLPWHKITRELQTNCRRVVSSSLHGIILSEALGIPVRQLWVSKNAGNVKFADFYESYRGQSPKPLNDLKTVLLPENKVMPLPYYARDAYARQVLKTFPIHLFITTTSTGIWSSFFQ